MTVADTYDLVIIGSGPGGYVAALRAAQLGLKTACVEKSARLGGVCLNVGCIPSKALLDSSEYYHLARDHFAEHGIKTGKVSLDLATLMKRKDTVVKDLTDSVRKLLEGNRIDIIQGTARLAGDKQVEVIPEKQSKRVLKGHSILLATGSRPVEVPDMAFDGQKIISSTEALAFDTVPKNLGIVGGGYIGLEIGSVWMRLGSKVTVIEMLPRIAAGLDGQVGRALERILKKQGLAFQLNTRVVKAHKTARTVKVSLEKAGKTSAMTFDKLLVAVGRKPFTEGLGIEDAGIETDPRTGHILVDTAYQTSVKGVFAIGDLIPGPMLAHKASAEGLAAVEILAGHAGEVNYDTIPAVVYTWPEVAGVGLTEEAVKEREIPIVWGPILFPVPAGRAVWERRRASSNSSPTARPTVSWGFISSGPGRPT